jgi:hypothetical protein
MGVVAADIPTFDQLVDLLRVRLAAADALKLSDIHSFKELMDDHKDVIADGWYWDAFKELESQGHLDDDVSHVANGGDACARLSADGRLYVRSTEPS